MKFGGKGQYVAKIWPESKIFKFSPNFTKLNIYTKNEEMNMFAEFQPNVTPRSAKMRTPILVGDPPKWGFHKSDEFFIFPEFFTRKCLFGIK